MPTSLNKDGSANITLTWGSYSQGANPASGLIIFWKTGTSAPGALTTADKSVKLPITATTYTFEGVAADLHYRFGIAAYKTTLEGMAIGPIQEHATWQDVQPATTPNFTGNIAGTSASTVKNRATQALKENVIYAYKESTLTSGGSVTPIDNYFAEEGNAYKNKIVVEFEAHDEHVKIAAFCKLNTNQTGTTAYCRFSIYSIKANGDLDAELSYSEVSQAYSASGPVLKNMSIDPTLVEGWSEGTHYYLVLAIKHSNATADQETRMYTPQMVALGAV